MHLFLNSSSKEIISNKSKGIVNPHFIAFDKDSLRVHSRVAELNSSSWKIFIVNRISVLVLSSEYSLKFSFEITSVSTPIGHIEDVAAANAKL